MNEGTNISSLIQQVNEKYSKNIAFSLNYSNIPNLFTLHTWKKTANASHRLQLELQTEGFKDVTSRILVSAKWGECWVDQLLKTK